MHFEHHQTLNCPEGALLEKCNKSPKRLIYDDKKVVPRKRYSQPCDSLPNKGIVPISATCTLSILHLVKSVIFAQRIEEVK